MASLLPNGEQQFFNGNGTPLSGGSVYFYIPNTSTFKNTYQDEGETILNTNPVILDSAGRAVIWGDGDYRQVVYDVNNNLIWDKTVSAPVTSSILTQLASQVAPYGASLIGFDGNSLDQQFLSRVNRVVNSITALRAISKATYTRVFVTGYSAAGDGGGGAYYYDPTDTTSADNGGSIIVATDGGRWKLLNNSILSVCQFGADATGVADSAPAFRSAIAAAPYGGTVFIPYGIFLMNSFVNNAVLDFTNFPNKGITLQGVGWTLKTGGSFSFGVGTGPQGSIIKMGSAITSAVDFYHQAPTDLVIGGVGFKDFAICGTSGAYGTPVGNNGLHFDGTANANGYMENPVVENVFIDNFAAGYSIFVDGVGNAQGVMAGAVFKRNKLMNFHASNFGDSNNIEENTFGANATADARNLGVYWYNVSGATSTRVRNNNFVNFNGMIVCDGAVKPVIEGNEMEQPAGSTNNLGVMLYMRGSNGAIDTPSIRGNSIAQDSNVGSYTPIRIANSNGASVSSNRVATLTNYNPVIIDSNSSYTLVEADNQQWVNGVVQRGVGVSDSGTRSTLRGSPWTTYTPTISADTGTFTTVSASGSYRLIDTYTLELQVLITITTAGTAGGNVHFSLPASLTSAQAQSMSGREVAATGRGLSISIPISSGTASITDAAGNAAIGNGYVMYITGTIQVQ